MRPGACGNGVDLAIDGPHRILYRALLEGHDVRHLHGRVQGGLRVDEIQVILSRSRYEEFSRSARVERPWAVVKLYDCRQGCSEVVELLLTTRLSSFE